MEDNSQATTEAGALDVSTPDGARTRISDLTHDKAFAERYNSGDRAAQAELDQLQRTAYLGEAPPPPANGPLTPELAKAKVDILTHDRAWGARYLANPQGPEGRELDRLQRVAAGLPETQEVKSPPEPGVPDNPNGYRFAEHVPEGSEQLATSYQTAAHAAGLSQGEFTSINEQQLRDAQAHAGKNPDEIRMQLDSDLAKIWGDRYDRMTALVERYVADYEREHPGTLKLINDNGLAHNKSLIVFLGHKALRRYGMGA
jgi:hypothetical protein